MPKCSLKKKVGKKYPYKPCISLCSYKALPLGKRFSYALFYLTLISKSKEHALWREKENNAHKSNITSLQPLLARKATGAQLLNVTKSINTVADMCQDCKVQVSAPNSDHTLGEYWRTGVFNFFKNFLSKCIFKFTKSYIRGAFPPLYTPPKLRSLQTNSQKQQDISFSLVHKMLSTQLVQHMILTTMKNNYKF